MSELDHIPQKHIRYIIAWIVSGNSWFMVLVLIYCLYIFNKIKGLVIYQERYPFVVRLQCCIAIVLCIFIWPLWAILIADYKQFIKNDDPLQLVLFIFYPYLAHAVMTLELVRLWIMYFTINYMNAVSNEQWISVVNNTTMIHNWYIVHNQTYGNIKWVSTRAFFYYLFVATTSMIVITVFGFNKVTQFIDNIVYAVPVSTILYLYWTLLRRKALIHDNFLFYIEFKTTSIWWGVSLFLYLSNQILFVINAYYASLLTLILATYGLSCVSIVSALYIPRKILRNKIWTHSAHQSMDMSSMHSQSPSVSTAPLQIKLNQIFAQKSYYECFIQHMIKEFSLESVLSWIEMNQFRSCLYNKLKAINSKSVDTVDAPQILCDGIPQSTIVFEDDMDVDGKNEDEIIAHFKKKYVAMFDKYIENGCEYEVNISYTLRRSHSRLKALYESGKWEITGEHFIDVFESVVQEMQRLLRASLKRFAQSADFIKIYKE